MKTAFVIIVVLTLSQTAFCRPDGRVTPLSQRNCADELFANLQRHVSELGSWLEYFLIEAAIRSEIINYSRDLCDKMLINDPPSFWEEYLFNGCISENDKALENESLRIRCELEQKVAEQPEILGRYLIEYTRCILPWTNRSANIFSNCGSFRTLP